MTLESISLVPSSSTSAGIFCSGLSAPSAGSLVTVFTRSISLSWPVSIAVTSTLRTNGLVIE